MEALEALLVRIMNFLADRFKGKLILKGGMLLRLLGSSRQTADLDYVWIRTKKRTEFAKDVQAALSQLDGIKIQQTISNSRGVFIDGIDLNSKQQFKIEINVIKQIHQRPETKNTAIIADKYSLAGRLIATMALSENFSNKIAAAIERGLARDFFDILELEGISDFDVATLQSRFAKIEINRNKAKKISKREGAELLRSRLESLSQAQIEQELSAWLKPERLVGLREAMLMAVGRVCRQIESMEE